MEKIRKFYINNNFMRLKITSYTYNDLFIRSVLIDSNIGT